MAMKSNAAAGYKEEVAKDVVEDLKKQTAERSSFTQVSREQLRELELDESAARMALLIQSRWRARKARYYVSALRQESQCAVFMKTLLAGESHICSCDCSACAQGESEAKLMGKVRNLMFADCASVLFGGGAHVNAPRLRVYDTGENWNQRFQEALALPEDVSFQKLHKLMMLSSIDRDFTSAATTYGKTIISEYFLHTKDKSIHPRRMGGVAGGQKYLWRGILFKLADGSSGPWNGSDEAAAKAAGHDLRGSVVYHEAAVEAKVPLHFPLMALIDYKGFRMTAQAFLPLRQKSPSLVLGSPDAGETVVNSDEELDKHMTKVARLLKLRVHKGGRDRVNLPMACDVEGHVGADGRYYVLDMARFMPPEHPRPYDGEPSHLDDFIPDGSEIWVRLGAKDGTYRDCRGNVTRAHRSDRSYDVVLVDGTLVRRIPRDNIQDCQLSIFWRLLRPEFVRRRGTPLGLSPATELLPSPPESPSAPLGKFPQSPSGYASFFEENPPPPGQSDLDIIQRRTQSGMPAGAPEVDSEIGGYDVFTDSSRESADMAAEDEDAPKGELRGEGGKPEHRPSSIGAYTAFVDGEEGAEEAKTNATAELADGYEAFECAVEASPAAEVLTSGYDSLGNDGIAAETEVRATEVDVEATPLSPDALTAFGKHDSDIYEHNRDVKAVTRYLFETAIPRLAQHLCRTYNTARAAANVNLSLELHKVGVNIRHMGLVRSHVPQNSSLVQHQILREMMLKEIVGRTLKQLLRDYMRRWMRSERSTSELGLVMLVTAFLNLTTGSHLNRHLFWNDRVVTGVGQRFGLQSLTAAERRDLLGACSGAVVLKGIVRMLCERCGIVLSTVAQRQFFRDPRPSGFEFTVTDIVALEARIKYPGVTEFSAGEMLTLLADQKKRQAQRDAAVGLRAGMRAALPPAPSPAAPGFWARLRGARGEAFAGSAFGESVWGSGTGSYWGNHWGSPKTPAVERKKVEPRGSGRFYWREGGEWMDIFEGGPGGAGDPQDRSPFPGTEGVGPAAPPDVRIVKRLHRLASKSFESALQKIPTPTMEDRLRAARAQNSTRSLESEEDEYGSHHDANPNRPAPSSFLARISSTFFSRSDTNASGDQLAASRSYDQDAAFDEAR